MIVAGGALGDGFVGGRGMGFAVRKGKGADTVVGKVAAMEGV